MKIVVNSDEFICIASVMLCKIVFMFIPRLKTVTVSVIFVLLISCLLFVADFVGYGDLILQEMDCILA